MKIKHFATILLITTGLARADTIDVIGQRLTFSNPSGYCTLGDSQRERELMDISQRVVSPGTRIIHAAIRCPELEEFKRGERDELDHWLQIQLIGQKGEFKRMETGREAFLAGIAKTSRPLNTSEMNRRINAALSDAGLSLSKTAFTFLGRDGNAVYFSARMNLNVGDTSRPVTGLSGMTLVNALPMTISVYEGTGTATSRKNMQATLQQLLLSVLTEN